MELLRKLFGNHSASKPHMPLPWISELNSMDDISAIEFTTLKLSEDFKKNAFKDESNLDTLFSVDEKTHIIVERISTHFVNIENISADLEDRISNAVFLYHRQLFITYFSLIESFEQQISKQSLHVLMARAMRNATQMIKWRYYNYQSAPANVWLQISELFLFAEKHALLNAKIQAYSDQEPVSLSTAYIHASMLGTLETLSLKCQQIELASKMLVAWTSKIEIEKVFDEKQHLFYIDTAANRPAKRIRNFKPANTHRFWCFDSVNSKIDLCMSLIEFNILPKQPLMQELVRNKDASSMFEILHTEWSRIDYKRQRRSEERTKATQTVTTAYGFKDICDQIRQYDNIRAQQRGESNRNGEKPNGAKSLEERLSAHSVSRSEPNIIYMDLSAGDSRVVDQSSKGLGLNITKHAHEVGLDMLVGVTFREQRYSTKLGMIRSIKPTVNHELHIGVELLSNVAFCTEARNISMKQSNLSFKAGQFNSPNTNYFANTDFGDTFTYTDSNFGNDPNQFMCLYLPKEQSISQQETLIIPKLQYNKNDIFKVNILGEDIMIRFTKSFERHGNWVRVTFTNDIAGKAIGSASAPGKVRPASA